MSQFPPPTSVTAVAGNSSADITWAGMNDVHNYSVYDSNGTKLATVDTNYAPINGLTNGVSYSFYIVANYYYLTSFGELEIISSDPSVTSNQVTPSTIPDPPTDVSAIPGDSFVDISWNAPSNNGGSSINKYTVSDSTGLIIKILDTPPLNTYTNISNLSNGTPYTLFVNAWNLNGESTDSLSVTVTPSTIPDPPTDVSAIPFDSSANISWVPPSNNGGSPIINYTIYYDTSNNFVYDFSKNIPIDPSMADISSGIISGLSNGTQYYVKVTATNLNGESIDSSSVTVTPGPEPVVCFMKGTYILTEKGYVPVENLKAGTVLLTNGKIIQNEKLDSLQINKLIDTKTKHNFPKQPIQWTSSFTVNSPDKNSYPICLKRGSIDKDKNMPSSDLYVSPEHSICVKNRMIPAKLLINGQTIFQDTSYKNKPIEYYHIEMPYHCAIISNGLLTESYLDSGNRGIFKDKEVPRLQNKRQTVKQQIH